MNKAILWFAAGTFVGGFMVFGFLSGRELLKPVHPGAPLADHGAGNSPPLGKGDPSPGSPIASETGKKMGFSRGTASFYDVKSSGTLTASGTPLNDSASTAAHRTLPFGTLVRVTNLGNGLSETVEITDRGPFTKGRLIDLSRNAAVKLDMIKAGVISVEIEVLPANPKLPLPSLVKE